MPNNVPSPQRENLVQQRSTLEGRWGVLRSKVDGHNQRCSNVPKNTALATECRQVMTGMQGEIATYVEAVKSFNNLVSQASAETSEASREQDEFERMNAAWLRRQQEWIRSAVERDKKWREEVLNSIRQLRVPEPAHRPTKLADLQSGDTVLLAPEGILGSAISEGDRFIRAVDHLGRGEVFRAVGTQREPVSHIVTVVKSVGGNLLYMDHTSIGTRILDSREFLRKYGHRGMYVARPQTVVDGRKLWEVAREAALQRKSDFGILGNNAVCSERSGIAIAKASGLLLTGNRLGPIDITPGDFFDNEGVGKYFLVSPLQR